MSRVLGRVSSLPKTIRTRCLSCTSSSFSFPIASTRRCFYFFPTLSLLSLFHTNFPAPSFPAECQSSGGSILSILTTFCPVSPLRIAKFLAVSSLYRIRILGVLLEFLSAGICHSIAREIPLGSWSIVPGCIYRVFP